MSGWIAVDFDGTLAHHDPNAVGLPLGDPILPMLNRVRRWLADGQEVRIFTARVGLSGMSSDVGTDDQEFCDNQRRLIEAWCEQHLGRKLKVTATKDFKMIALYDDRAYRVEFNTGRVL